MVQPIKASNLVRGVAYSTLDAYFTKGLIAHKVLGGWALAPGTSSAAIGPLDNNALNEVIASCGATLVGYNEITDTGGASRQEFWRPATASHPHHLDAHDAWRAIAFRLRDAGRVEVADAGSAIAIHLYASGIRLRDVAREHHEQLQWAIAEGRREGGGFSNIALYDLYVDFHSLASELGSTRDYLAKVAALRVGAKASVDSLARLIDWVGRPTNAPASADAAVALLLSAWGSAGDPGWLRELGEVRNELTHRQPMARHPSAAMLRLASASTRFGTVSTIRLAGRRMDDHGEAFHQDPFEQLVGLYHHLQMLASALALAMGVSVEPPDVNPG